MLFISGAFASMRATQGGHAEQAFVQRVANP